jgi:hypothetical protein
MKRKSRRIVAALVLLGALAAGGAAFTNSATIPNTVAGYGTSNISGATATSLTYTLSADGTQITTANLTFQGDLTSHRTVQAGFDTNNLSTCTIGAYDSTSNTTAVTCSGYTESTAASQTFNVAVTNS